GVRTSGGVRGGRRGRSPPDGTSNFELQTSNFEHKDTDAGRERAKRVIHAAAFARSASASLAVALAKAGTERGSWGPASERARGARRGRSPPEGTSNFELRTSNAKTLMRVANERNE